MPNMSLPSIQEMFPDHLVNRDLRGLPSKAAEVPRSTASTRSNPMPSECTIPGCDCSMASSSRPSSRHRHSGPAFSSAPLSDRPSSKHKSKGKDDQSSPYSYDLLRSDPTTGSLKHLASSESGPLFRSNPRHDPGQEPLHKLQATRPQSSDSYSRVDESHARDHRQYLSNLQSTQASTYRARSRSPSNIPRVQYPYPPPPASTAYPYSRSYSSHSVHSEDDELEGDEYDDMITDGNTNGNGNTATNPTGRKHVCPTCFKRFNRPSSLKIHVNTHTGATPFRCPWPNCGREFNVNSNMRRHYRNHLTPSRNQGIFPLAPPPTTVVPHLPSPNDVPALVPAAVLVSQYDPSKAPLHGPMSVGSSGPTSDRSRMDRHPTHAYDSHHDDHYHRGSREQERTGYGPDSGASRDLYRHQYQLSQQQHRELQHQRQDRDAGRGRDVDYTYGSVSSTAPRSHAWYSGAMPSPPVTHSSVDGSDVEMDVDSEYRRRGYRSHSPRTHPYSPKRGNAAHNRQRRPPALSLDDGEDMDVISREAYPTPLSKRSDQRQSQQQRPITPAGSSFRSSSPSSASSSTSSSAAVSRFSSPGEAHSPPKYTASKPHLETSLKDSRVSTTLRPAFS